MDSLESTLLETLDASSDAIYVTDDKLNILYINETAKRMSRIIKCNASAGGKCYKEILGRDTPCPFCRIENLSSETFTTRNFPLGNHMFELRGKLIKWGGIPAHIEYIKDVTEKLRADKLSADLLTQKQSMYDHIGLAVCLFSYANNEVRSVVCNEAFRKTFQLPKEFDRGDPLPLYFESVYEDDRENIQKEVLGHLNSREPFETVCRIVDKSTGLLRSIFVNMECCTDNGEELIYATFYDVTSWIEQEHRLNNVLRTINGGIITYKVYQDGQIERLMYTDALAAMQGYTRQEYDGLGSRSLFSHIYPDDRDRLKEELMASIKTKTSFSSTVRITHKTKDFLWVNIAANPTGQDLNGALRYTAIFTNVSSQFELYRELLDISSTGLILTDASSHEIYFSNNIANSIIEKDSNCSDLRFLNSSSQLVPRRERGTYTLHLSSGVYQVSTYPIKWMNRSAVAQYLSDITEEVNLQKALKSDEERYRLVVEMGGIALMDYNAASDNLYLNDEFKKYAITNENTIKHFGSQHAFLKAYCDDEPLLAEFYSRLGEFGFAKVSEIRLEMADGSYHWCELHGIEMYDEGRRMRSLCFIRDTDDVIRQYKDLQMRYDYEIARQDSFEDGVVERLHIDLTTDSVIKAVMPNNKVLPHFIGATVKDLLNARLSVTHDTKDKEMLSQFMNKDSLLEAYYHTKSPTLDLPARVHNSSERKYFRSTAHMAKNPANSHVIAFIETRDIDKEKTQEMLMHRLLEINYESVVIVNAASGAIKIGLARGNDKFVTDNGQYDEMTRTSILNNVVPDEQERVLHEMALDTIRQNLETMPQCSGKTAHLTEGGRSYKMWTAAYFDSDRQYILITTANITNVYKKDLENARILKNALEEAELASLAKSQFLARMSHEIRTPITTVSGVLELLRDDTLSNNLDVRDVLQKIETASTANRYLLTLINDILDISKIESNELRLAPVPNDIIKSVNAVLSMIKPLAKKKNISLEFERLTNTSDWFIFDSVRLSQILMNILNNAVKFTSDSGTITFTGEVYDVSDNVASIKYLISDTGVGISDEFKPYVFEPFKQEYTGTKNVYGGTGIGLSISRSLARLMGGDITFESEKNKGTTFIVTVKLEIADEQENSQIEIQSLKMPLDGLRVLICEDNKINQMIVKQLLEKKGCKVVTADDGQMGIEVFSSSDINSFDAILMDIRMPRVDGLEATKSIRRLERSDAKSVPIIAMSANAYAEDKQLSLDAGMNDHLSKPVIIDDLCAAILKYTSLEVSEGD